jgi:hypothetical protein
MPSFSRQNHPNATPRRHGATVALAALAIAMTWPGLASAAEWYESTLPVKNPTCHAHVFTADELAAHPDQKVTAISVQRIAGDLATERKWHALEQFDGTPVISATLRVHLRNDPASHSARLECTTDDDNNLICSTPSCPGGQIQIASGAQHTLNVSVGGTLKSGQFIAHYLHLDDSCEGHPGGPIVLESGSDDHQFSLTPAAAENCK